MAGSGAPAPQPCFPGAWEIYQLQQGFPLCGSLRVPLGVNVPNWSGAFRNSNRREKYIYILFLHFYAHFSSSEGRWDNSPKRTRNTSRSTAISGNAAGSTPSPVATGGFGGISPPKQSSKPPQIETLNTKNKLSFG